MAIVDQSRWRYVVTDLNGSTRNGGGEIFNTSSKQYSKHINAGRTAQITLNIDNPRAGYLLSHDTLLKVYRKNRLGHYTLMLNGDVIQAEEDAQGDMGLVTVVATDAFWRFQRRQIGLSTNAIGQGVGYTDGTSISMKDYSILIKDVLTSINGVFNSGVSVGTIQNCGSLGYIGPVYGANVADIFQQLTSGTVGGPEFEIQPLEPTGTMPATIISQLNLWLAMGQTRANTLFEYGTGKKNVATYSRILSKDGIANVLWSPPQGWPTDVAAGDSMVSASDSASQNAVGRYEDILSSSVTSPNLRQQLCAEYLQVLKNARQQVIVTPSVGIPYDFTVDYDVGDIVTARAWVNGSYRFNGTIRLYGVDVSVDDNDQETPSLTLVQGG